MPGPNETKSKTDSSFENLSTDLLYSKFRLVIVDCRLNTLQQEVTLPHCLTFEVLAASRAEQLKKQITSLLDYKDSYHICLIGLDANEEQPSKSDQVTREASGSKISIRQFHEYVLRFLVVELLRQGFKFVSTLPSGFQQVHDLARQYGFLLIDHEENDGNTPVRQEQTEQESESPIDTPILVSLQSCYHCLAQRTKKRTTEHQNSMVVKKYGSMLNTLDNASFCGTVGTMNSLQIEKREKSVPEDITNNRETMGIEDEEMQSLPAV